jgi:hypothetical protein
MGATFKTIDADNWEVKATVSRGDLKLPQGQDEPKVADLCKAAQKQLRQLGREERGRKSADAVIEKANAAKAVAAPVIDPAS